MFRSLIVLFFLIICSCSSKKDILLVQDIDKYSDIKMSYDQLVIKSDDILKIDVSTQSPELSQLFNFTTATNANLQTYQLNGYLVDINGNINFPLLGTIKVKGLTLNQASKIIEKSLFDKGILVNPTIDIKLVNAYFTVIGEVNNPGRYSFISNDMDIFQVLGMAGDLTINGERKNIKILRKSESNFKVSTVDVTSIDSIKNKNFQIFPGDIIIVNPNNSRVKNAGLIGNAGNLLSLLSFLLSSIIVINAN